MIDERKEAQACLYVLGALPPVEAAEFEQMLPGEIELQLLVHELRSISNILALAVPRVHAPASLKAKILARIGAREAAAAAPGTVTPWSFSDPRLPWAIAGALFVITLAMTFMFLNQRHERRELARKLDEAVQTYDEATRIQQQFQTEAHRRLASHDLDLSNAQQRAAQTAAESKRLVANLERELARRTSEATQAQGQASAFRSALERSIADLDRVKGLMMGIAPSDPNRLAQVQVKPLNPTAQGPPNATGVLMWDNQDQRGIVLVEGLVPLPQDRDYQLWAFVRYGEPPVSAGVIYVEGGEANLEFRAAGPVEDPQGFAISVERKGGVETPQGNFVMRAR